MTYEILWRFEVPAESRKAFEEAYGPNGPWAALFGKASGFLEVRLLRSVDDGSYLTIDRWTSQQAFAAFHAAYGDAYAALDKELEGLATVETRLGAFEGV